MGKILAVGGAVVLIAFLIILCPMLLLWSANTIGEQANLGYYIPHNVWTYLASYGMVFCLRGGK